MIDDVNIILSGVFQAKPNTSFRSEIYVNIAEQLSEESQEDWGSQWFRSYARLEQLANTSQIEKDLTELIQQHLESETGRNAPFLPKAVARGRSPIDYR